MVDTQRFGAIETEYKGYRFRSRLEARWAVFFDALGLEWQYEPQGFEVGDARYLPDFYLPKSNTWIEVKGSDELLKQDADRMEMVLDFGSPVPGIMDSDSDPSPYGECRGLLILGDIPDPDRWGLYFHPIIRHHKGLWVRRAYFTPTGPRCPPDLEILGFFLEADDDTWTTRPVHIASPRSYSKVFDAYRAARSARFEFGQTPTPKARPSASDEKYLRLRESLRQAKTDDERRGILAEIQAGGR